VCHISQFVRQTDQHTTLLALYTSSELDQELRSLDAMLESRPHNLTSMIHSSRLHLLRDEFVLKDSRLSLGIGLYTSNVMRVALPDRTDHGAHLILEDGHHTGREQFSGRYSALGEQARKRIVPGGLHEFDHFWP
jgi:hypothetical protein